MNAECNPLLDLSARPVIAHRGASGAAPENTLAALREADLRAIDAGARFTLDRGRTFPFRATDVRIPTLTEILRRFPGMPVLLEIKEVASQEAVRQC